MGLPAGLSTVVLSGTYARADGTPLTGQVNFIASKTLNVQASGGDVVLLPVTYPAMLDANGHFTITLPATDAPQILNQPFTYTVTEYVTGYTPFPVSGYSPIRTYSISLPHAVSPVDISSVDPIT